MFVRCLSSLTVFTLFPFILLCSSSLNSTGLYILFFCFSFPQSVLYNFSSHQYTFLCTYMFHFPYIPLSCFFFLLVYSFLQSALCFLVSSFLYSIRQPFSFVSSPLKSTPSLIFLFVFSRQFTLLSSRLLRPHPRRLWFNFR